MTTHTHTTDQYSGHTHTTNQIGDHSHTGSTSSIGSGTSHSHTFDLPHVKLYAWRRTA